jgi:phosphoribosylamine--glycine ligase
MTQTGNLRMLVVGGGAREHALVWKLQQSARVSEVIAAPGNAGIETIARTVAIAADDLAGLQRLAETERIDLTVVGPEISLAVGIVDAFQHDGLRIFGPSRAAAQIEASKLWAKGLMDRANVPCPRWAGAASAEDARQLVRKFGTPVVLKADGLAAGKGTVVCHSRAEAEATIDEFMVRGIFGEAGQRLEIEEFLEGPELSVFALSDGEHVLPLLSARDHKALLDGNMGPNTGGMGGYARPAYATSELLDDVHRRILEPTVHAMAHEGCPYVGVLYAGLILTSDGPRVIEFNCRWGDPEAQLQLPLLQTDLVDLMDACLDGALERTQASWHAGTTLGVTLAAGGSPGPVRKGDVISGLDRVESDVLVFHAATRRTDAGLVTDGGRVLTVVAAGSTLGEARERAYRNVSRIHFEGMQFRSDLGADEAAAGPAILAQAQANVR